MTTQLKDKNQYNLTEEEMYEYYPDFSEESIRVTRAHFHWVDKAHKCRICGKYVPELDQGL